MYACSKKHKTCIHSNIRMIARGYVAVRRFDHEGLRSYKSVLCGYVIVVFVYRI